MSRLLLETRAREEATGTAVELAGGKILRCDDAALAGGTTIAVRDLFYNVPARKKFLRSEQTEIAHVASLITHYSLAHPDKSFLLRHNNSELLDVSPVATLRERVYQVFGSKMLEDLLDLGDQSRAVPLPAEENDPTPRHFRLRGFVSGPQVQRLNRNSIYLFVNGRLIRDRLLLHAISASYHNLMPQACYPFALLFLDCDLEEVDVNVHPSKTEVRFRHGSLIHDFVRDTIRDVLMAQRPVSSIPAPAQPAVGLPYSEFTQGVKLAVPDTHGPLFADATLPEPESLEALKDLRPLGQIHDSFIIAAGRDGLWIIDQHVAHERILFEQVLAARGRNSVETQGLLMPLVIQLTPAQQLEYARIADELNSLGFDTEPFGNRTIAVKSAPAAVGAGDVEKVIFEILEIAERELRKASVDDLRRAMAASIACRAAIKINMRLEPAKMDWLLRALAQTSSPMSCPHGRPIALRYATRDILKSFHRI